MTPETDTPDRRQSLHQWLRAYWLELALLLAFLGAAAWLALLGRDIWQAVRPEPTPTPAPTPATGTAFDGQRALGVISFLTALGPRVAGSDAHAVTVDRIEQELRDSGWQVDVQEFELEGVVRRNVVAKAGAGPLVLVGAHYDSSPVAERDSQPENRATPPPGANDGGSGAAVLLELARSLDQTGLAGEVWLVFFDGQYRADGAAAAAGVAELARQTPWPAPPQAVVLLDLLGARDQRFYVDASSDPSLSQQLWDVASQLSYGPWFAPEPRAGLDLGQAAWTGMDVPVAVIAGGDTAHWRTLQDTLDQIDPEGLARVGAVLKAFLESGAP